MVPPPDREGAKATKTEKQIPFPGSDGRAALHREKPKEISLEGGEGGKHPTGGF